MLLRELESHREKWTPSNSTSLQLSSRPFRVTTSQVHRTPERRFAGLGTPANTAIAYLKSDNQFSSTNCHSSGLLSVKL